MIASPAMRSMLNAGRKTLNLRLLSGPVAPSMVKVRDFHSSPVQCSEALAEEKPAAVEASGGIMSRFVVTAEVSVSKLFPGGFGWQTASVVAGNMGYATDSLNFALTTGFGDAVGVLGGHVTYYGLKKMAVDSSINMSKEFQTGFLLGCAAMCSGTAWQPLVDLFQGAGWSFLGVFTGTWVGCGSAFYVGLRGSRTILSGFMTHIEEPTFENSVHDTTLSVAIGGATGFFVGTDAAYLPEQNFLIDVLGIKDGTPDLTASAIAGTSTAMGFAASQSAVNVVYPSGKCWID
mmetsp:Transcript_35574/g.54710  ORF Transcript_35574/g.54710 Transcript_35574/m.54710 type:complete len:290 (-) Transcript_35574:217-1086(-)|eukprot:CAMPEP_0118688864 /NCGR_PEP_ID=MMETSP0800-20121206/9155_1 /TAXON_ID=210618 ORGANISM="Striatella unipunctata, Strain CCMP2910" /NCGR_SAMPLE_ID=MMETSP0800 /ASSEMBLY_ACC=CAM_ASM_000638 /LENGTH=289 /DNA_ID=CAMNT_0006586167 /DNA_START=107 /DNA_END=976 /DNA_ORIENTATION=-